MRLTKDGLMFSDLAMSSIDAWVQIISDNSMVLDLIRTAVEMEKWFDEFEQRDKWKLW